MNKKKGIIYDLDGTLVSTAALHKAAWKHAAQQFGITLTPQMLSDQNGMRDLDAARMMLPGEKEHLAEQFAQAKALFVAKESAKEIEVFPFVQETLEKLRPQGYAVWICISAQRDFVARVIEKEKALQSLKKHVVSREMYHEGKPSAQPLLVTLENMHLEPQDVVFVGDAFNDYLASKNAGVDFLYFVAEKGTEDPRIPKDIPVLSSHEEIFEHLL